MQETQKPQVALRLSTCTFDLIDWFVCVAGAGFTAQASLRLCPLVSGPSLAASQLGLFLAAVSDVLNLNVT